MLSFKKLLLVACCLTVVPVSLLADDNTPAVQKEQLNDSKEPDVAEEPAPLTIGSQAPALEIENWVQDGNGKFKPVTTFAPGKVYVVEFWATWCGPCISAMPHIAQLQEEYADQGVQVVSISDEDLETVEGFLKKEVRGDAEGKTYKELTSVYCLTCDPDGSAQKDYMEAAGQNGIPTAFIVGKEGLIEWIGHPMSIDEPIAQIVAGEWDRVAFAQEYKEEQEMQAALDLARRGDFAEARHTLQELNERTKSERIKNSISQLFTALDAFEIRQLVLKNSDDAPAKVTEFYKDQDSNTINDFAWLIVQLKEADRKVSPELMAVTMELTEKAVKQSPEHSALLDTYAHLLALNDKLDEAIAVQRKAVELADDEDLKEELTSYLEELEELKSEPKDSDKPKD